MPGLFLVKNWCLLDEAASDARVFLKSTMDQNRRANYVTEKSTENEKHDSM